MNPGLVKFRVFFDILNSLITFERAKKQYTCLNFFKHLPIGT